MSAPGLVVRVLPDLPAVDRGFDYLVGVKWAGQLVPGARVRVPFHGRRVGGWVLEVGVEPPAGLELLAVTGWSGLGPSVDILDLAAWAAWRWACGRARFLRCASPGRVVTELPPPGPGCRRAAVAGGGPGGAAALAGEALAGEALAGEALAGEALAGEALEAAATGEGTAVVRLGPRYDPLVLVEPLLSRMLKPAGTVLLLAPSLAAAAKSARALRVRGWPVAALPDAWAAAAAGGRVVVGARSAAWGPAPGLVGAIVLDAHDRAYQHEPGPAWLAWQVLKERASRAAAPCVLISACPSVEMLEQGVLVVGPRPWERRGWAPIEIVDQRSVDPRSGLFSPQLVALLRTALPEPGRQVLCILNRKGRARLLACGGCGELARCEHCGGPMEEPSDGQPFPDGPPSPPGPPGPPSPPRPPAPPGPPSPPSRDRRRITHPGGLVCRDCCLPRPRICLACSSGRMRALRVGVTRAREELEALTGMPVEEVSGPLRTPASTRAQERAKAAPIVVGTVAALLRFSLAAAVAFLDIDQELLAPRFRAGEEALDLLCRASRTVPAGGRVMVQTRVPDHEVLLAARRGDPDQFSGAETERRRLLRWPPFSAVAVVSGAGAEEYAATLRGLAAPGGAGTALEVRGPDRGAWLVRAPDHSVLSAALNAAPHPKGYVRAQIDPWNL